MRHAPCEDVSVDREKTVPGKSRRAEISGAVALQLQEIYRQATTLAAGLSEATGVHPTDIRALRLLDAAVERPMTIGELGAGLGLSSGAVSELVDRLEASGLAERVRDESDRRRVLVQLGPAAQTFGREQLAPIATAIQRAIADADDDALIAVRQFLSVLLGDQGDS